MATRVTRSASRRQSAALMLVENLAGEIHRLIKRPDFRCPDDLRRELMRILHRAYDGRRMICEIQHALYSRKLAVDWLIRHLNGLRQRHGWVDTRPSSSSSATCICGDPECICDDGSQVTLLGFEPDKSDKLDEFVRQGLSTDVSAPSRDSEEPTGVEVHCVTRLRNGLYASPLAPGRVAITTTLTPSTDSGTFVVLPKVPEYLIVPPEPPVTKPTTTRLKRRETFKTRFNKSTRRRSVPPTVHTQSPRRRLVKRMIWKTIAAAIAVASLAGATRAGVCLANRMLVHDLTLRIV